MDEKVRTRQIGILLLIPFSILWVIFFVGFFTNNKVPNESITGFGIVSFGIVMLLFKITRGNNKYGKLFGMLLHYCTPHAYVAHAEMLLDNELKKKRPREKNKLLLFLAIGYYAEGKFNKAMETLQQIGLYYHYKNAPFIANYYHRQFLISLEMERQDIAWGSLVNMRDAIAHIKNVKSQRMFTRVYEEDMHILNAARGNYEGVESAFKDMFQRAQTNYERSFASFMLGGVYMNTGKKEEAANAYEYVLAHGNHLYIADKAAEYLGLNEEA